LFLFGNNNLFRKAAIEEAGLYNERLRTNFEDVSMSEALSRRGYTLVYEPAAVVEHLRTDTLQSVIKANWKWRFFGYRNDVTLKNVIEHARKVGARELRSFLGVDYNRSDILSGLLSCIAVAYALFSDLYYYTQHRGESRIHDS
jgi:GT2 family glycosyltransferase